jgi:putative ABC transport system permease protein
MLRFHLALGLRSLIRRPGFTVAAILLLALGTGANAAVFSVVRGVLLRPLPFSQPDRLVAVWPGEYVSNQEIGYWRESATSLDQVASLSPGWLMALVAEGGEPLNVTGARVSDNLFETLGVRAALGRTIVTGESTPGRDRVVVLSDRLWRQRFAADPDTIGRSILIDGEPYEAVGVMPAGFEVFGPGHDLWTPIPFSPGAGQHNTTFSVALGRLTPTATIESATLEFQTLAPAMREALGRPDDWGRTMHVASLQATETGEARPALLLLLGAVGLILLLAAVNLGTLVLGRTIERARELAVRAALGASRGRLISQLLTEQAVLAATGALAGLGLAGVALPLLISRIPPEIPRQGEITLDGVVFATVLGGAVGLAVLMALVPIGLTLTSSASPALRQQRSTDTPGRRRALGALVAAQVALALVLGVGAGLMLRSVWNLQQVDPGFDPGGVLTFRLQTTSSHRALTTGLPYMEDVVERVRALPGVTAVGAIAHVPLSGYAWTIPTRRADQPLAPGVSPPLAGWRFIWWDYFETMRIPLRLGRGFTEADRAETPAVAIVNDRYARQYFGEPAAALGQRIVQYGGGRPGEETLEIVGVVGDVRHLGLDEAPVPEIFRPLTQTFMFPMQFVVRSSGDLSALAPLVRGIALDADPTVPVAELQPLTTLLANTLGRPRLLAMLLTVFAGAGLLLSVVGLYGVAAYRVRQQEREIGIRLALGATPSCMARRVVSQGLLYAGAGVVAGLPAAFAASRLMDGLMFGITPRDPATFATLPVVLLIVTIGACYFPARRASRIDPAVTMRQE